MKAIPNSNQRKPSGRTAGRTNVSKTIRGTMHRTIRVTTTATTMQTTTRAQDAGEATLTKGGGGNRQYQQRDRAPARHRQRQPVSQEVSIVTCDWKPGGIASCYKQWRSIISDPVILDLVRNGAYIEFIELPEQENRLETHMREDLACHLNEEVQKFLDKGIIAPTAPEDGDFYSTVFLRETKDGKSFHMIINLKPIKNFICD